MKIEILKSNLDGVISSAAKVSNKNLSLPVLGCVVIVANGEYALARATNLDVSLEIPLNGKVSQEGVVAVPAHTFSQIVSTATDEKVTLTADENTLIMKGARGEAKIKTLDHSEFPNISYVAEGAGVSVSLQTKELSRALKSVSFAASTSGMRPELASVLLSVHEGYIIAAATDSFRLAEVRIPVSTKQSVDPVLIPARNINDIIRVIAGGDTTEVRIGENQCTFISGGAFITSRTIDGAFPEYKAIIPAAFTASATMLTEDAVRAFRKVSVFTDSFSRVGIEISPEKKEFSISASSPEVGTTNEVIEAALDGEAAHMFFNARYITDALGAITTDSVVFKVAGEGKPVIIEEVQQKGFMCLVMPMNK